MQYFVRFEAFTLVKIQVEIFRVVTPWTWTIVVGYQRFGGPCCLHIHQNTTWRHSPKGLDLNMQC